MVQYNCIEDTDEFNEMVIKKLSEQSERLREALAYYAEGHVDFGQVARDAMFPYIRTGTTGEE